MWWKQLEEMAQKLRDLKPEVEIAPGAKVSPKAVIKGPVYIGPGTIVDHFAIIEGPVHIGANCIVGDGAKIRAPAHIADGTRIGRQCELRNTILKRKVSLGPQCFVCDSVVEEEAFLGAMVRTSNFRLDRQSVSVMVDGKPVDTGLERLGAHIGARSALGIMVIIYPGRIVPRDSLFEPGIKIKKNLAPGTYVLKQELDYTPLS
ncbi:MAG TPA: acetyltransferase [Candidatus Paceibacterota bacterium]|nr:acetyltransferase [Candidatus Paceibacterota bacterium]